MTSSIKKSSAYLNTDNQDLSFIFSKVKKLRHINEAVLPCLPTYIRNDCQVANISGNTLILMTATAAVFSELRYLRHDLLIKIKQHALCRHIEDIQFKIHPSLSASQSDHRSKKMPLLSADIADIVKHTAESIADPALQAVMRRIAERKK